MILLMQSSTFEYDIRGLIGAFYPGETVSTEMDAEDPKRLKVSYGEDNSFCELEFQVEGKEKICKRVEFTDFTNVSLSKTALKRALYWIFQEETKKELPWGTLTGIRPVKIPMADLKQGKSEEEARVHLEGRLLVSPEKAQLAIDIAKRENKILKEISTGEGYSLYIGIPFCPTICLYCSFASSPLDKYRDRVKDYLAALKKELKYVSEAFKDKRLDTIYMGGGTPTTLEPEELKDLFDTILQLFDISALREWTVEAGRPDSVTREKLEVLKAYPITRISINPQTMHQKTLDLIGRKHTVSEIREVYAMAKSMGFDNINMDLILGLPGEDEEDMKETLKEVVSMGPENVTVHSLAIKRAARLNTMQEVYKDYKIKNSDEIMSMCHQYLGEIGQKPYYLYRQKNMAGNLENVGFALPGKEGIYNILIMEEVQTIVACGAGASTKRVEGTWITRAENVKNVDIYIRDIDTMIERKKQLFKAEREV